MTEKIVIFGDILSSAEWEKTKLTESLLAKALSFYGKPVSSFLQKLVSSFDKLKIVGVSDSISEKQAIEVAKPDVSEILNKKEYQKW